MKRYLLLVAALVAVLALAGLSNPLYSMSVYQVTCNASTATSLNGTAGSHSAARVWINNATAVYVGGPDVDATHGLALCTTAGTCIDDDLPWDGGNLYCLSSSGSITAIVMAGK